ncbi:MAG: hypothetical protein J7M38_07400, partial [Armatimonadetes bacterium]|nr:hypothetical protein [Armatimonadota bacterium]
MADDTGRLHYGWVVLAMSTLVVFGSLGLARFGYTVVLPAMQEGLGLDNTHAGALATATPMPGELTELPEVIDEYEEFVLDE